MIPTDGLTSDIGKTTRRAVMKAVGAALGTAAIGSKALGHDKWGNGTFGYLGDNLADSAARTERVGYHSAGDVGPASVSGQPEDAHIGAMTEFRVHDDLAFVTMFTAREGDDQRMLAIFDISDFTRAESKDELEDAELSLLSFVRNDNGAGAPIDCKVSDDGNWVFVCKQPLSALFGESEDPGVSTSVNGFSPGAASVLAIDVSDPENPMVTDEIHISRWVLGPHNCWYHQINGDHYVFTVHGADGISGSLNVFRFDSSVGQLQQVNNWEWEGQTTEAAEPFSFNTYAHDFVIQEDPKYGIPIGYLPYINAGTRILDMSDPMNIEELGVFEMEISHHSVPAPALIDGKRVMLCGQENPGDDQGSTGFIHLVDVDPIDEVIEGERDRVYLGCSRFVQEKEDVEPFERPPYHMYDEDDLAGDMDPLDDWALIGPEALHEDVDSPEGFGQGWQHAPGFEEEARLAAEDPEGDGEDNPGEYTGYAGGSFRLSTHNLDIDTEGNAFLGHYHAGSRFFKIVPPGEPLPEGPDVQGGDVLPADRRQEVGVNLEWKQVPGRPGQPNDQWRLVETGYNRRGVDVPIETTFIGPGELDDGLSGSRPFHWCLVERNGVAFAGGINAGPQLYVHDDIEVGNDTPVDVDIDRDHSLPAELGGQTHRITITAESDEEVIVRDWVPESWDVIGGHIADQCDVDGKTVVTLNLHNGGATYYVQAPDATGTATFGPVEYARAKDGEPQVDSEYGGGNSTTNRLWRKENSAVDTVGSVGAGLDL